MFCTGGIAMLDKVRIFDFDLFNTFGYFSNESDTLTLKSEPLLTRVPDEIRRQNQNLQSC